MYSWSAFLNSTWRRVSRHRVRLHAVLVSAGEMQPYAKRFENIIPEKVKLKNLVTLYYKF